MNRITHEHIVSEAQRIRQITGRNDSNANWLEAIETLKIFPNLTYDASDIAITTNAYDMPSPYSNGDHSFGCVARTLAPGFNITDRLLYMHWHYCREMFERDMFHGPGGWVSAVDHGHFSHAFYIQPKNGQEYRVPNFIRDVELDRLHLSELTTFMRVSRPGLLRPVLLVRPSSFWSSCPMRFSLLTVLCRAGRYYFYNSIEDALMSYDYSRTTFAAINLFFQGRRNYVGDVLLWNRRWVANFENLHESQVTSLAA